MPQDPYEIIAAPYDVYIAAVGVAFPLITAAPSGSWTLLGRNGAERYTAEGVSVKMNQTLDYIRTAKLTGPAKAIRKEEDLMITFTLVDLQPIYHTYSMAGTAVTSGSSFNTINLYRGTDAAQFALLVRGDSPLNTSGNTWLAQYEIPRAVQAASPDIIYSKNGPAGLKHEWRAIVDPSAASDAERFGRYKARQSA